MKRKCILVFLIFILTLNFSISNAADEQTSCHVTLLDKNQLQCFFDKFSLYLETSKDRELLRIQQNAIKDLKNNWRDDEQYVVLVGQMKTDIDLTIYYHKPNPALKKIYLAGISQPLAIMLKEINKACQISGWETPKKKTRQKE